MPLLHSKVLAILATSHQRLLFNVKRAPPAVAVLWSDWRSLPHRGVSAAGARRVLHAPEQVFTHLDEGRVARAAVQVHQRLDQLGPQRVALAAVGRFAVRDVVELWREAELLPHLEVVVQRAHRGRVVTWGGGRERGEK